MSKKATMRKNLDFSKSSKWHKKISANRGPEWAKSIIEGRQDSILNPSNLRMVRLGLGITRQEDFARDVGLSKSTYCAVERGIRKIKSSTAEKIAKKVGKPLVKLFKQAGPEKYVAVIQRRAI
jgi:DNA-binding XRE family transcriptional regulator